jgi:hypothetical protein
LVVGVASRLGRDGAGVASIGLRGAAGSLGRAAGRLGAAAGGVVVPDGRCGAALGVLGAVGRDGADCGGGATLGREGWLGCADCAGFDGAAAGALGGADLPLSPRMAAWRVSEPPLSEPSRSEPRMRASPLPESPTRPVRVPASAESTVAGGAASTAVVSSDEASTVEVRAVDDTIPERRLEMARILSSCECAFSPSNQARPACSREYL